MRDVIRKCNLYRADRQLGIALSWEAVKKKVKKVASRSRDIFLRSIFRLAPPFAPTFFIFLSFLYFHVNLPLPPPLPEFTLLNPLSAISSRPRFAGSSPFFSYIKKKKNLILYPPTPSHHEKKNIATIWCSWDSNVLDYSGRIPLRRYFLRGVDKVVVIISFLWHEEVNEVRIGGIFKVKG